MDYHQRHARIPAPDALPKTPPNDDGFTTIKSLRFANKELAVAAMSFMQRQRQR